MSATLTASATPAMRSRAGSVARNVRSLTTANGGWNVPTKFLRPERVHRVLHATPESFCEATVVG
jgi:hypothetical protein